MIRLTAGLCGLWVVAGPPAGTEPLAPPTESATVATSTVGASERRPAKPDPFVQREYEALVAFADGGDTPDVQRLFEVPLIDESAIRRRKAELDEVAATPGPGRALAELRGRLLANWLDVLARLSEPSRQALEDLARPKADLRATAAALDRLQPGLIALTKALGQTVVRARAGGLVGFRTEVLAWARTASQTVAALKRTPEVVRSVQARLRAQADRLDSQATQDRQRFFAAALRAQQPAIDALFEEAILRQRNQPVSGPKATPSQMAAALDDLVDALADLASNIDAIGDTTSAQLAVDQTNTVLLDVQRILRRIDSLPLLFEEADLREAVTLLLPVASAQARARAYPLGTELVGELRAELRLLWAGTTEYWTRRWSQLRAGGLFGWGPRVLLALFIVGLALYLKNRAGRFVSALVRRLARTEAFRGRVGGLVRWAGLLQALAPVGVVTTAGYLIFGLFEEMEAEVQFIETAFRWLALYWLGRNALLGAARRVSAGRPALIDASDETLDGLRRSYNQIGLVLAIGAIVEEWSRTLLVLGRLRATIEVVVAVWAAGWLLYACIAWRRPVARHVRRALPDGSTTARVAEWMQEQLLGALLVIPAIVVLIFAWLRRAISALLSSRGVFTYFKARSLRRQAEATGSADVDGGLAPEYRSEFPLYPVLGEQESVFVPRNVELDPIVEQFRSWQSSKRDSSLALVGEKGIGKTTLLAAARRRLGPAEVSFCTLRDRLLQPADVVRALGPAVGASAEPSLEGLAEWLNEGPERAVIVDDAHLSFLRTVDGYRGFDALVQLVNGTGDRVFWILAFNDYAWAFLNAAHGGRAYFRRVQPMKRWTSHELRDLIGRRTKKAGYELAFDESLMDDDRSDGREIRLIEGADGFFRLLWEASQGNPRAATSLWLNSLVPQQGKRLRVQLFSSPRLAALDGASDDVLFALAAIAWHENLNEAELQATLNVDATFARFALRFLTEYEVVGSKFGAEDRYTLRVAHYGNVVQTLKARNLLLAEVR